VQPHTDEAKRARAALRSRLREFLGAEMAAGRFSPRPNCWLHYDADFTRRCGEAGFIGVTFPQCYGGRDASPLERFVICEEMLAAGAPVGMHWIADRQSGPQIVRHGSEEAKRSILPQIAQGQISISIGMSEPGVGSDLASVRTRAVKVDGGWRVSGSKLWTSHAHRSRYLIALVRSAESERRHEGLSQLIVDLSSPGVSVRPITDMGGERDFCEVFLDDVFVPDSFLLGRPGDGWKLVLGELAFERSGPERFMSSFVLLPAVLRELGSAAANPDAAELLGRLAAHFLTLRHMSGSIAELLEQGVKPDMEAAVVKDLGAEFERDVVEAARVLLTLPAAPRPSAALAAMLGEALLASPSFTLRGGTREILRGIIARQMEAA